MDMYVYAKDDAHAISKAKMIAKKQDDQYDNRCNVIKIDENPFGSAASREVLNLGL